MLVKVEQILQDAINKCRNLSHNFNPPTLQHFGLIPAIECLIQELNQQFGLNVKFELKTKRQINNQSLKTIIFRSVQELLFNVIKHSGIKTAHVILSQRKDALVITVSDQGRGFNPEILKSLNVKTGLGLVCLRERIYAIRGKLKIKSAPGKGSKFILTIPFG
jgi:signal transduction histidine kinase